MLPNSMPYTTGPGMKARAHRRASVNPIDSDLSSSATHLEKNSSVLIDTNGRREKSRNTDAIQQSQIALVIFG